MNGDAMAARIRDILRDNPNTTEQGVFWQDAEIRLALNASQDAIVNFCFRNQIECPLVGLLRTAVYTAPSQAQIDTQTGYQSLPADYCHYASAYIPDEDSELINTRYPAKLYLGADAEAYRNSIHVGVNISNNNIKAVFMNNPNSQFVLMYYCYPSYIDLTSLTTLVGVSPRPDFLTVDFTPDFYDIILRHAAVLLGMKETQTQRDFKKRQEELLSISLIPRRLTHLVKDIDDNIPRQQQ